jgi:hypothetical protein
MAAHALGRTTFLHQDDVPVRAHAAAGLKAAAEQKAAEIEAERAAEMAALAEQCRVAEQRAAEQRARTSEQIAHQRLAQAINQGPSPRTRAVRAAAGRAASAGIRKQQNKTAARLKAKVKAKAKRLASAPAAVSARPPRARAFAAA